MNPARHTTAAAVVLSVAGGLLAGATTSASAAASCTSPVYKRQFFANTSFSGTAKKTDCDNAIDQTWTGAPASGLPKDNFGVRWSVTRDFGSGGPFALAASGLDGIRVYVDGVRKVDLWKNTSTTVSRTANVTIPKGKHTLRIDYANWTGSAKVKFTYTPRTSATVDKVKPLAPTGTAVSYASATGKAKLTWSKNKEMDLSGYRVYRRLKGTTFGTAPLTTTASTTYTDTPPATGDTYYYEIRARDKAGNESAGTADQPVATVLGTPQGLAATSTANANSLAWKATSGATSYEVFRAVGDSGAFTRIAVVGSPAYTDTTATADVPYAYKVRALSATGNTSPFSAVVSATRDTVAPLPPEGLTLAAADEGGVTLTWRSGGSDTVKYNVYRSPSSQPGGPRIGSTSTTAYRDTAGEPGQTYTYIVKGVDAAGNESTWKNLVNATRPVGPSSAPRSPSVFNPYIVGDQLSMSFENTGYVPVSEYVVYRSRTTPVDTTVAANRFGSTGRTFEATVSAAEQDYYYAVVAVSPYGVRSAPSGTFRPSVLTVSETPLPTEVAEVAAGDGQVQLIWGIPPTVPNAPGVVGFRVYRSTTPGFTKENAESSVSTQSTSYTDTGLTNGTTYYYAVATVAATGAESELSPEVSATPSA